MQKPPKFRIIPKIKPVGVGLAFGRNPNRRQSAMLSLRIVQWLPTALWQSMKIPVAAIFSSFLLFWFTAVCFVGLNAGMIVAGLLGYLKEPEEGEAAPVADSQS